MTSQEFACVLHKVLEDKQVIMVTKQADDRAALLQLETQFINASCSDPGVAVTSELFLPMVRKRLLGLIPGPVREILSFSQAQQLVRSTPQCAVSANLERLQILCKYLVVLDLPTAGNLEMSGDYTECALAHCNQLLGT